MGNIKYYLDDMCDTPFFIFGIDFAKELMKRLPFSYHIKANHRDTLRTVLIRVSRNNKSLSCEIADKTLYNGELDVILDTLAKSIMMAFEARLNGYGITLSQVFLDEHPLEPPKPLPASREELLAEYQKWKTIRGSTP